MSISPLQKRSVHGSVQGPLPGPTRERAQTYSHSVHAIPQRQLHQTGAQVAFSGSTIPNPVKAQKLLEHLDFTSVGASPVKQIALIFSSLITWRLLAANERRRASVSRRWNELRENLFRDLLGFGFWFLGVPVLQRVYLAQVSRKNPQLKDVLIRHEKASAEASRNLLGWVKSNNPLSNRYIPSSQQVKDQMQQALSSLKRSGLSPSDSAYQETQAGFQNLIKHRNIATAIGLGSTILLLGVGINLLNFWLTKRNVSQPAPPQTPMMPMATQPAAINSPNPTLETAPFANPPSVGANQPAWPNPGLVQNSPNRAPLPVNPFAWPAQPSVYSALPLSVSSSAPMSARN